jgi:uncharacterized repeat protein (TIGR01451 family)
MTAVLFLFSSLLVFPSARAVEVTTTPIVGPGSAVTVTGGALGSARGNGVPLNNAGFVAISNTFVTNFSSNIVLVTDGTTYTSVDTSGPGSSVLLNGIDIDDQGTVTYQRNLSGASCVNCAQFFTVAAPYTNGSNARSIVMPQQALELSTNSRGRGVARLSSNNPQPDRVVRLNEDGTITELVTFGVPYSSPIGRALTAKILENDDIYVAVHDSATGNFEIWRFADFTETPPTHTVVYSRANTVGSAHGFDVNENGDLLVAETDTTGLSSWLKVFPAGGTPYIVPGSEITGSLTPYQPGVFINRAGLVAAGRRYRVSGSAISEIVYAVPGGAAEAVLATGDTLNGGTIFDAISPTSKINDLGQITIAVELVVSGAFKYSVTRINPAAADLSVTKTAAPDPVNVGSAVTYTLTVTNNGPQDATGVTLNDSLPTGMVFVSATPSQGTCSGTTAVSCSIGALGNGFSATVAIVATPTQAGTIRNTASVTCNEFDPHPENNSDTREITVHEAANLSITKAASPNPVTVGTSLTYTLTVTNGGPSSATGVTVNETLPTGMTFVSSSSSQGTCSGTSTVSCSIGALGNGSSATVTIVVTPTQTGGISNTATVIANEVDPDTSNNSDTRVVTVNGAGSTLSALTPGLLWVGQNDAVKQLKFDLRAEILLNGNVVGSGTIAGVSAGGADFSKTSLKTIALALGSPPQVQTGDALVLRVSVRSSCSGKSGSGVARLWYNGQPIDAGKPANRDAGSRFGATIGSTNTVYFARAGHALSTAAGASRQFDEVAVNDSIACSGQPGRPYVAFPDWSVTLP